MKKLLQLLNEYQTVKENWYKWDWNWWQLFDYDDEKKPMLIYEYNGFSTAEEDAVAIMISKAYWFIEWLMNNSKIDTKWFHINIRTNLFNAWDLEFTESEIIMMLLSIQDEPLQFLKDILV